MRRDISWLAARNLLTRTRGGAENLLQKKTPVRRCPAKPSRTTSSASPQRKRAIARHAAGMCTDGETIIINGGTTTFMMAEFLADKQLKILTNSFLMAERLLVSSENEIILPGGKVYREQNVILSPFDNDITQHHYAGKMFMSVYGLSLLGLMEADPLLIQAEKRLISQAEELIVLADSSKFAKQGRPDPVRPGPRVHRHHRYQRLRQGGAAARTIRRQGRHGRTGSHRSRQPAPTISTRSTTCSPPPCSNRRYRIEDQKTPASPSPPSAPWPPWPACSDKKAERPRRRRRASRWS